MTTIQRTNGPQSTKVGGTNSDQVIGDAVNANEVAARGQKKSAVGVDLSPAARRRAEEVAKAKEIAMNTPDVREDRIAALKNKINAGEYQINPENIADGILREAILDELAKNPE